MYAGPAAKVIVGPEKIEFSVQMSLLFHFSKLAERALNGEFKESKDDTLILLEMDPDAFSFFLRYMYQGTLGVYEYYRRPHDRFWPPTEESSFAICTALCRLYVLVDYMESQYRNCMLREILQQLESTINEAISLDRHTPIIPSTLAYVLQSTMPGSSLYYFVLQDLRREFASMVHRPIIEYCDVWMENKEVFANEVFEKLIEGFHWGVYGRGPHRQTSYRG